MGIRAARVIGKKDDAPRTKIDIAVVEIGLIVRSEVVTLANVLAERKADDAVADIPALCVQVECAVARRKIGELSI